MKKEMVVMVLFLLLIYGCAQPQPAPQPQPQPAEIQPAEPLEPQTEEPKVKEVQMPEEVQELLSLADQKVKSISYKYIGPETNKFIWEFYVKGDKAKYIIDPTFARIDLDDDAYEAIYVDKGKKTATASCDRRDCQVKGIKADLSYSDNNILTPLDWLEKIESGEIVGEEQIDRRATVILDSDAGKFWIDTFFGAPLQVEADGIRYQFMQMKFNGVSDVEVTP